MVMRPDVVDRAIADRGRRALALSVAARPPLDQARVAELAAGPGVGLLCGRFEGIDQSVIEARAIEEVSLGDFVLSGGEPAAIALIDACVRLLPGVVGEADDLGGGEFRRGPSGISPLYTAARYGRTERCRAVLLSRPSRGNPPLAPRGSGTRDAGAPRRSVDPISRPERPGQIKLEM